MLPVRHAARVLLVDARGRSLWLRYPGSVVVDPADPASCDYWALPGGGVENGESYESAARREVFEELGVELVVLEGWFADRCAVLHLSGTVMEVRERFYWGFWPVDAPVRLMLNDPGGRGYRWWTLSEMSGEAERFVPRGIIPVVASVCVGKAPSDPVRFVC